MEYTRPTDDGGRVLRAVVDPRRARHDVVRTGAVRQVRVAVIGRRRGAARRPQPLVDRRRPVDRGVHRALAAQTAVTAVRVSLHGRNVDRLLPGVRLKNRR